MCQKIPSLSFLSANKKGCCIFWQNIWVHTALISILSGRIVWSIIYSMKREGNYPQCFMQCCLGCFTIHIFLHVLGKAELELGEKNNLTLNKWPMIYIFISGYARSCFLTRFLLYQCTPIFWKKCKWETISLEPMGSSNHWSEFLLLVFVLWSQCFTLWLSQGPHIPQGFNELAVH